MHPVSCVTDAFSSYRVYFYLIFWNWCHLMNYIFLMISVTMMGMSTGTLVRAIYHFALINMLVVLANVLVVFVSWGLAFFPNRNWVNWWHFFLVRVRTKRSRLQRWLTHRNVLPLKILIFPSNLKIRLGNIFLFWPHSAYYSRCNFTNKMVGKEPVGSTC